MPGSISNPGGGFNYVNTAVYSGAGRAGTWTDIDISGHVGAREVLAVFIASQNTGGTKSMRLRQNGTSWYVNVVSGSAVNVSTGGSSLVFCITDANGIVEAYEDDANSTYTWTLLGYCA